MKEKPIYFTEEEINDVLFNGKVQKRFLVCPRYKDAESGYDVCDGNRLVYRDKDGKQTSRELPPPFRVGDLVYVRESWCVQAAWMGSECGYTIEYRPNVRISYEGLAPKQVSKRWYTPVRMPKEIARIRLEITGLRVERLQDISDEDVQSEGHLQKIVFKSEWNKRIGTRDLQEYGWDANPLVWVIEFKKVG